MGGQVDFFIYLSPGQLKIIWEFLALSVLTAPYPPLPDTVPLTHTTARTNCKVIPSPPSISYRWSEPVPGKNTWVSHPQTSWHRHCQTLRSSWGQRTAWPTVAWRRTRSHPQPPGQHKKKHGKHKFAKILKIYKHTVQNQCVCVCVCVVHWHCTANWACLTWKSALEIKSLLLLLLTIISECQEIFSGLWIIHTPIPTLPTPLKLPSLQALATSQAYIKIFLLAESEPKLTENWNSPNQRKYTHDHFCLSCSSAEHFLLFHFLTKLLDYFVWGGVVGEPPPFTKPRPLLDK